MKIHKIIERPEILSFLQSRNLLVQYKKCKNYLLLGLFQNINLKVRRPKKDKIYYFRINKQYRALCVIVGNELRVIKIDDHSS